VQPTRIPPPEAAMSKARYPIAVLALFSLALPAGAADRAIAPSALFPAPGATAVCPDTSLHITFSAPPSLAKGQLQIFDAVTGALVETLDLAADKIPTTRGTIPTFNTRPALIDGNTLHLFPTKPLAYDRNYYLTLEALSAGADSYAAITTPATWRFTTRNAAPLAGSIKLTVAADNSGDFASLQAALDFIPEGNTAPTTILLKKGTYHQIVAVTNKHNLTIVGEDRKGTILSFANNANFNPAGSPYRRGLFIAHRCNDLTLANMTFHNTTPRGGSQAEAVILDRVSRAIITDLDLFSFQDTLQINGQAYIQNSFIEGDVDFIWGTGPCFFQNVTCTTTRSRAYFTQLRNTSANHGYIFNQCTFTGAGDIVDNVLSRIDPARFPNSEVVLIDCIMNGAVGPAAWRLDNLPAPADQNAVKPETYPNIHFWEHNSRTPEGAPVDTSKRHPVSRQLKDPADAELIKNYRTPAWVLGNNWTPQVPALFDK
jgi:pectin methylesterase-like acyl-CoA thioesterase